MAFETSLSTHMEIGQSNRHVPIRLDKHGEKGCRTSSSQPGFTEADTNSCVFPISSFSITRTDRKSVV